MFNRALAFAAGLAPLPALAAGGGEVSPFVYQLMVFAIAIFVGYYVVWSVTPADMKRMIKEHGEPVAITGKAGSLTVFDCNLMHASGHNLSANDRWQAYFCYNTCANRPMDVEKPRPDYVRSTNWTPLRQVADDAMVKAAMVPA